MAPVLYAHPFSSYSQKALIALYENETPFSYRVLQPDDPATFSEFSEIWPIKKFPILVDSGRTYLEATIVIEYLAVAHPGPVKLIPDDPAEALQVRMMDRIFDNYIMTPMQKIVGDSLRPEQARDPHGVGEARTMLDSAYAYLDSVLGRGEWAASDSFSLADCAAAPSLFYADWAHEIRPEFAKLKALRARLLARPSVARAIDEARPYRSFFPLGAPNRD